jgi:hypothetical protein
LITIGSLLLAFADAFVPIERNLGEGQKAQYDLGALARNSFYSA